MKTFDVSKDYNRENFREFLTDFYRMTLSRQKRKLSLNTKTLKKAIN